MSVNVPALQRSVSVKSMSLTRRVVDGAVTGFITDKMVVSHRSSWVLYRTDIRIRTRIHRCNTVLYTMKQTVTRTTLCKGCGDRIFPGEDATEHIKHWNQNMSYDPEKNNKAKGLMANPQ